MTLQVAAGTLYRSAAITQKPAKGNHTVDLSFASSTPVQRPWGREILQVDSESVRLGRISREGPVLINHDTNQLVGKVENCWLSNGKARATVRLSKSTQGLEVWDEICDGIRTGVSFGYTVHNMEDISKPGDEERTFLVTDWEPLEITLASIPADVEVGIGRAHQPATNNGNNPSMGVDIMKETQNTELLELRRKEAIRELGDQQNQPELARTFIQSGKPVEDFQRALLAEMETHASLDDFQRRTAVNMDRAAQLGLSDTERGSFSILRAMRALAFPGDKRKQEEAGFELEVSRAYGQKIGKTPRGIFVPYEVMNRDLTKAGSGSNLVATDLHSGSFIEVLRKKAVILRLATVLTGLRGNVAIPRQTAAAAAGWVAEGEDVLEQTQVFDHVTLTPKSCGAYSNISRKMIVQSSPDADHLVTLDLASAVGTALDSAAIAGSGVGEIPTGVLNATGVGVVDSGDDGSILDWGHITDMESLLAASNADSGNMAYLTTPGIRGHLKQKEKAAASGQFVWENRQGPGEYDGILNGYPAYVTNQVPSGITQGLNDDCHAVLFGDWKSLIVGLWTGVDLLVDQYTNATKGAYRVIVFQEADIAIRHPESFAVMQAARTA